MSSIPDPGGLLRETRLWIHLLRGEGEERKAA
jgi:hypothetical protein